MSINLHLIGDQQKIDLVQTPTYITAQAMKLYDTGNTGIAAAAHALKVYQDHLLEMVNYYEWDEEDVASRIREVIVFLLFAPGARFTAY